MQTDGLTDRQTMVSMVGFLPRIQNLYLQGPGTQIDQVECEGQVDKIADFVLRVFFSSYVY